MGGLAEEVKLDGFFKYIIGILLRRFHIFLGRFILSSAPLIVGISVRAGKWESWGWRLQGQGEKKWLLSSHFIHFQLRAVFNYRMCCLNNINSKKPLFPIVDYVFTEPFQWGISSFNFSFRKLYWLKGQLKLLSKSMASPSPPLGG